MFVKIDMKKYIRNYLKTEQAFKEEFDKREPVQQEQKYDLSFCGTIRERQDGKKSERKNSLQSS